MSTLTAQAPAKKFIPGKVYLESSYYGFKNQEFYLGNCISNTQVSSMVRSKVRENEYSEEMTLERLVNFDLKQFQKYVSSGVLARIKERALQGVSQTIFLVRNPKMRHAYNNSRFIGLVVLDNKGAKLDVITFFNHIKTYLAVHDVADALTKAQKAHFDYFNEMGRSHQVLS